MCKLLLAACLVCFSVPAMASCDSLKSEIDAKLQAKGVVSYTLDIVPVAQAATAPAAPAQATGKVVGSCEGDTKQIVYTRH